MSELLSDLCAYCIVIYVFCVVCFCVLLTLVESSGRERMYKRRLWPWGGECQVERSRGPLWSLLALASRKVDCTGTRKPVSINQTINTRWWKFWKRKHSLFQFLASKTNWIPARSSFLLPKIKNCQLKMLFCCLSYAWYNGTIDANVPLNRLQSVWNQTCKNWELREKFARRYEYFYNENASAKWMRNAFNNGE